jgi:D-3-phosphoglycerate dehydrogenase
MKEGAKFLNISRGFVVDLNALCDALATGHLGGAAIDVYPKEPKKKGEHFESPLTQFPNVILSPHIGGSTLEAQHSIGEFVSSKIIDYVKEGKTELSVNVPGVTLPQWHDGLHRITFLHKNVPGVLAKINRLFGDLDVNIDSQVLGTWGDIGYVVSDVSAWVDEKVLDALRAMPESLSVRVMG